MQFSLLPFEGHWPRLHPSVFLADGSRVIGNVSIGAQSSVWYNTVVRGDVHWIEIGQRTNIQDLSCLHVENGQYPLKIGDDVTIGHHVTLHGCTLERACLVGMGAVLLNGCEIGEESLIAAHTIVPEGLKIPPGSLVMGVPGRVRRALSDEERHKIAESGAKYCGYVQKTVESMVQAGVLPSVDVLQWHHSHAHCKKDEN